MEVKPSGLGSQSRATHLSTVRPLKCVRLLWEYFNFKLQISLKKIKQLLTLSVSLPAKSAEEPIYSLPPDSYPSPNPGWVLFIFNRGPFIQPFIFNVRSRGRARGASAAASSVMATTRVTTGVNLIACSASPCQVQLRHSHGVVREGGQRGSEARGGKRCWHFCRWSSAKQPRVRGGDEGGRPNHAGEKTVLGFRLDTFHKFIFTLQDLTAIRLRFTSTSGTRNYIKNSTRDPGLFVSCNSWKVSSGCQ